MKKIAIKPHKTRGIELIEILECMGGYNSYHLDGFSFRDDTAYLIDEDGIITSYTEHLCHDKGYKIYTLEEWEDEYKSDEMIEGLVEEDVDLIPKFGEFSDNEPLDIPTMTTDFIKEHGLPCPNGYIFKDENGNVINATKIVLEKKKGLTQKRINTIVHESCILFCEHCGCGVPRDTCMSLGTCEEYDDYRKHIKTYLENYGNTNKERLA